MSFILAKAESLSEPNKLGFPSQNYQSEDVKCSIIKPEVSNHVDQVIENGDEITPNNDGVVNVVIKLEQEQKNISPPKDEKNTTAIIKNNKKHTSKISKPMRTATSASMNSMMVYKCDECNKVLPSKKSYNNHIKRYHIGLEFLKCDFCSKMFSSKSDLMQHQKKHLNKRAYTCDVCHINFNYQRVLRNHKMSKTHKDNVQLIENGGLVLKLKNDYF